MNKILKRISFILGVSILLFNAGSCSDEAEELTSVEYDRLFAPTNLEIRIQDKTNIRVSWECLSDPAALSYSIELFANDPNMNCEGTPSETYTGITENPYTIYSLDGETTYSFRIKAIGETKESNWTTTVFTTEAEQLFKTVADEDISSTSVILRWTAGEEAATITVTPTTEGSSANIVTYSITSTDIANGCATIEGLTPETSYQAVMTTSEGKVRGNITFTTAIDTGGMTLVEEGADLIAALDAAADGEGLYLEGGTYELGDYALTKSISIASPAAAKATINGRFTIGTNIASLTLTNIIFDGQSTLDNVLQMSGATGNLAKLTFEGCEIRNMVKHLIYNGVGATIGDITINNCIWDNIEGNGGDGFDFRDGDSLGSLTVTNTTFSNGVRTFLRCQAALSGNISFTNCTFYNICNFNNSNNNGLFRITNGANSTLTVQNCIFYGIGFDGASGNMGVWARTGSNMAGTESYANNYWYNSPNLWGGLHATDNANVAIEANPGFVDAANGDFTVTNEDMIYYKVGDPRWLQ